jgi:hypothetical protein
LKDLKHWHIGELKDRGGIAAEAGDWPISCADDTYHNSSTITWTIVNEQHPVFFVWNFARHLCLYSPNVLPFGEAFWLPWMIGWRSNYSSARANPPEWSTNSNSWAHGSANIDRNSILMKPAVKVTSDSGWNGETRCLAIENARPHRGQNLNLEQSWSISFIKCTAFSETRQGTRRIQICYFALLCHPFPV